MGDIASGFWGNLECYSTNVSLWLRLHQSSREPGLDDSGQPLCNPP